MGTYYSSEKNVLILIALMKAHGIKKIVASPGTTNVCLVASLCSDPWFEMYSSIDERSAAYLACGLAAESGEPVALSCTQATASRNYLPGLTEAYYRKLPVLAITSTRDISEVGHKLQQVIDRSVLPKDAARLSIYLPSIHTEKEYWACEVNANRALLELKRRGGGPVHINLGTEYTSDFSVRTLPKVRKIDRVCLDDELPALKPGAVGIFVASHLAWSMELTQAVDAFCEKYNAVVLCDQTSNYHGKYGVMEKLVANQKLYRAPCNHMSHLIHIGNMSGSYLSFNTETVWRVSPDGEVSDPFEKLSCVFEMEELAFFQGYLSKKTDTAPSTSFFDIWKKEYDRLTYRAEEKIDEIPFSNIWIARQTLARLPEPAVLHLGIYNSLRCWSFFETKKGIMGYANVGGFGIDGGVSALVGASFAHRDRLYYGIVGDLAFFYDINVLGNRHLGENVRLMVINNGCGTEFKNMDNFTWQAGVDPEAVSYISAEGHFGNRSKKLVRHYAEDLGFIYLSAENKQEFLACLEQFTDSRIGNAPILFEVFTNSKDEREALEMMYHLGDTEQAKVKQAVRSVIKDTLGDKGVRAVKKIIAATPECVHR